MAGIHCAHAGSSGPFVFNKVFSSDFSTPYNLRADLVANGWNGVDMVLGTWTINGGVVVSSNTTATAAFTVGSIPSYCDITVTNNGYIVGMGGAGGMGGSQAIGAACSSGGDGGTALAYGLSPAGLCVVKLNNNGIIAGGGGGGGGAMSDAQSYRGPGGGGGATGRTASAGGATGYGSYGGSFGSAGPGLAPTGNGNSGAGGSWGAGGTYGSGWPGDYVASNGGSGGYSITNIAGFTVLVVGTRYGGTS